MTKEKKAQGISNPKCPKLLTLKQASDMCGLSVWALRERVWAGDIPYIKFPEGRKVWIDEADLSSTLLRFKQRFEY